MEAFIFQTILILSVVQFILPSKGKWTFNLLMQLLMIAVTSMWAFSAFIQTEIIHLPFLKIMGRDVPLVVDKLSAFFILVINFTALTAGIYARGYLQPYLSKKSKTEMAFHYFNFFWLHASMLLVVMLRDILGFLILWELMSLSSFFLVIFESEKKETVKIGISYLIQMHIGVVLIMMAFILAVTGTGAGLTFESLSTYFTNHHPFPLFLVFFVGFGIKAGFIPLHSWLPHAHPAAPSHVSGLMSGVMIKMGIYGILRVLTYIHHDLYSIGLFILCMSLISGIIGVSLAIVQHDIKRLLAYHSIENIGIIGIGIGLGVIGLAKGMNTLAVLGFAGGLLHILNHSLFKSLLFYTAGAVYRQTHTRNIEQLGGLIKKMPKTSLFFLLGALAISGLPPLNGFISEYLIYFGTFKSLHMADLLNDTVLLFSFSGLVIIGGLAIFCFTKVFSIVFLGTPRSHKVDHASEVGGMMILPNIFIGLMIIIIGMVPALFIRPLTGLVDIFIDAPAELQRVIPSLHSIGLASLVFISIFLVIWALRAWQQKKATIGRGSTWGCGYSGANPALHQYTATSYADNFQQLTSRVTAVKKEFEAFEKNELFPKKKTFSTHSGDVFEENLISKPGNALLAMLKKAAVFQTGKIQHYLLYAVLFIIVIYILTILNWI